MRAILLKSITVSTFAQPHCSAEMVLSKDVSLERNTNGKKYLLHGRKLFYYEYFIPETTINGKKSRDLYKKLILSILWISTLSPAL